MSRLRNQILSECFMRYDGEPFAGGDVANNKLDLERMSKELRTRSARLLWRRAAPYEPVFISAVPDGANPLGEEVAFIGEIPFVSLRRSLADRNVFEFASPKDLEFLKSLEGDGVVIEDAFTRFTNTRRLLAVPEIGRRIVAVEGIFDRGFGLERQEPNVPWQAIITEYIPAQMPSDAALEICVMEIGVFDLRIYSVS